MILDNIYIYVRKNNINNCKKYGMKLTDYSDISFKKSLFYKKGITAYFSPKDNMDKYTNNDYDILRIKLDKNIINNIFVIEKYNNLKNIITLNDYSLGMYKEPNIIITTSILQERIYNYNKILDVPLLINNSKDLYNEIKENEKAETESFIKFKDIL